MWNVAVSLDQLYQTCPWRRAIDPRAKELEQLLITDPILSRLYPSVDPKSGVAGGYYIAPSGAAGPIDPKSFVQDLLTLAWDECRLSHIEVSSTMFVSEVSNCFSRIVAGIQSQFAPIPVRSGVAGIRLPDAVGQVEMPHGYLRNSDERDSWRLARICTSPGDRETPLIYESALKSGGKVVPLEEEASATASSDSSEWVEHDRQWRRVRLALALVRPTRVLRMWDWARTPLGQQQVGGCGLVEIASSTLTIEEVEAWKALAFDLEKLPVEHIDVAIDRSLRMLDGSRYPDDLLINSVMAWENLFGATGDTSFRVAACLALILEPDSRQRSSTFTRIKKLYDLRSQVVHGSSHLKGSDFDKAYEAQNLTFDLLRTIITSFPELVSLKNGNERSKSLILREGAS